MPVPWLDRDPHAPFPPASSALRDPDGLLAAGGDLSPERLLNAYRNGIFPWYSDGQPILWWCPDPRWVFGTDALHLSRRFRRTLRHSTWSVRADTAFAEVIAACAHSPRGAQPGTWIGAAMQAAYCELHRLGHAHSIEVFDGAQLVGGLYGVAIGHMFFGESMFSGKSGGSTCALAALARQLGQRGWPLIDAQVDNPHLVRLGAQSWPRDAFMSRVAELTAIPEPAGSWSGCFGTIAVGELAGAC